MVGVLDVVAGGFAVLGLASGFRRGAMRATGGLLSWTTAMLVALTWDPAPISEVLGNTWGAESYARIASGAITLVGLRVLTWLVARWVGRRPIGRVVDKVSGAIASAAISCVVISATLVAVHVADQVVALGAGRSELVRIVSQRIGAPLGSRTAPNDGER